MSPEEEIHRAAEAIMRSSCHSWDEALRRATETYRPVAKPADRWEYKLVDLPAMVGRFATSEEMQEILRPYGLEGWELVHVGGAAWMKRRLG